MNTKIKAGIIGAAGYTGGELIRVLLNHPLVEIVFAQSNSSAGKYVYEIHRDLTGDTDMRFSSEAISGAEVLFLCSGHGEARKFMEKYKPSGKTKIIDLSQDYRLSDLSGAWIYGLPELNRERLREASRIANPGCFATCIQLALLPLASAGLLLSDVHINATTGSTGAGQTLSPTSHFSWRQNNLSIYKAFEHQHLAEIRQSISQMQPGFQQDLFFVPQRGNFTRGILAGLYLSSDLGEEEAQKLFLQFYESHPFVHLSQAELGLKQVVNTNKCLLKVEKRGKHLFITSIIDNLLKGASGQAVQNFNLLFGLEETTGLKLKASAF